MAACKVWGIVAVTKVIKSPRLGFRLNPRLGMKNTECPLTASAWPQSCLLLPLFFFKSGLPSIFSSLFSLLASNNLPYPCSFPLVLIEAPLVSPCVLAVDVIA